MLPQGELSANPSGPFGSLHDLGPDAPTWGSLSKPFRPLVSKFENVTGQYQCRVVPHGELSANPSRNLGDIDRHRFFSTCIIVPCRVAPMGFGSLLSGLVKLVAPHSSPHISVVISAQGSFVQTLPPCVERRAFQAPCHPRDTSKIVQVWDQLFSIATSGVFCSVLAGRRSPVLLGLRQKRQPQT